MKLNLDLDNNQLNNLCGSLDENIILIEKTLDVVIKNHFANFEIKGKNAETASKIIGKLSLETDTITREKVELLLKNNFNLQEKVIKLRNKYIKINNASQINYIKNIDKFDCVFGVGPAGTGKTYLAVAKAVEALENSTIRRIVLVRPAVEAGENLGFLPGDMTEKIDPYLRPIYDALYEFLGFETVDKMLSKNMIEVAPLAFMRGRTLNEAFVILDEAQNTTREQMKMFLTRMGFGSKMLITGDISQIDIKNPSQSGLIDAMKILKNQKEISFCSFDKNDVLRHNLVKRIVEAYEINNN
jgi:phosphate starvation-inducible PhoH-like protein